MFTSVQELVYNLQRVLTHELISSYEIRKHRALDTS